MTGAGTGGSATPAPQAGGTSVGTGGNPAAGGAAAAGTSGAAGTSAAGGAPATAGTSGGAAGGPSTGTGQGFKACGKTPKEGACKATAPGVYAQRIDVDVYYQDENNGDSPVLDAGRGTLSIWFKTEISDICEDGSDGVATNYACGSVTPPLYISLVGGVVQ
ncbi:MAG: hypothetical protein ABW321_01145, partial [Polyangiales bacterium]